MSTARRVVVLVHGIHTSKKDGDRWMNALGKFLRAHAPTRVDEVVQLRYGWTSGVMIRLPLVGWFMRRRITKKLQKLVARITRGAAGTSSRPSVIVDVVAHSAGTWFSYYSTCRGKERRRTRFGRVVFMAGIVPKRSSFPHALFDRVLNLHSRKDSVVRLASYAAFGSSGVDGFVLADGQRVRNVDLTPYDHDDYLNHQATAWDLIADFLNA